MNGRKGLSLVLSGAMMVSMLSLPAMAADTAAPEFPDAAGSWASESIDRWGAAGVVNGDENGNFNPTASITRAELAQIFVNMFGLTEKAPNTYADLRGDEWYADAILKCTAAGIMQGDGVNANPMAMISRQETMVMFGRAMGVTPVENPDLSGFTDGASVADWAAGYMAPLAEMGIITGSGDGSIQPSVNIDRASTMALLDKAITVYINEPGEYSVDNEKGFVVVATDGEVKITGKTAGVVVTAGCSTGTVKLNGVTADTVKVDGTAAVSLENGTAVETVSVNSTAAVDVASGVKVETMEVNADADISNAGTITTLEANSAADVKNTGTIRTLDAGAAVRVDNSGTISKAEINADGVILDGRRPSTIDVADGVKNPTDSKGNEIKDNTGGGDYNPPSTETVGGIVGVNPVDQSGTIIEMPTITASAYKTLATGIITIDLSSSDVVPVHENAQHTKGAWVGFAIKAPEGVTSAYYTFGTEASDTASSSVELTTGDPNVGGGAEGEYYFVAFVNATAVTPKTYLTIDWDGEGEKYAPQKYEINLASVKTDVQKLENVTTSLDKLPEGVESSETGLAFDGSTALVSNGGSGTLTQEQVKGMGGGGEYTVYYAVPQEGLEFDKIVRTVNGKDTEWSISSDTAADAGEGWWTKDDSNYYFK
ncbi:MAG: S-layer homology domain-containing protein [Pseudoflavonifractor capillosus]|uniref:S-layer homology domain-containing protein n=1 Tax=Pseudoflavonifractor capillosus TaxID=106588 RepID=UPI0023FA1F2E|nr:S-layer homology domain-containing protein [Pseudoflavonifractor capillosus]MCI5928916.1 S-layer homology domain-containing protein [Pseudoflavonifractor capillosus]MDY4660058.1 S-layer homology domain-containing protein [Pseudoflavonifractor capillosus]